MHSPLECRFLRHVWPRRKRRQTAHHSPSSSSSFSSSSSSSSSSTHPAASKTNLKDHSRPLLPSLVKLFSHILRDSAFPPPPPPPPGLLAGIGARIRKRSLETLDIPSSPPQSLSVHKICNSVHTASQKQQKKSWFFFVQAQFLGKAWWHFWKEGEKGGVPILISRLWAGLPLGRFISDRCLTLSHGY